MKKLIYVFMILIFASPHSIGQTNKRNQNCSNNGIKNPIPMATSKAKHLWSRTRPVIKKGWEKTKDATGKGIQTIKEKVNDYKLKQKNKRNSPNKTLRAGSYFILVY